MLSFYTIHILGSLLKRKRKKKVNHCEFARPFIVPPRWIREPQDTALMLGQAVVINCEAEGYPKPEITFLKGGNKSNNEYFQIKRCSTDRALMSNYSNLLIFRGEIIKRI